MKSLTRNFGGVIAAALVVMLGFLPVMPAMAQRRRAARRPPVQRREARQPRTPAVTAREPELQLDKLPPDPAVEAADVAITANVKARSLVFEVVPNPTVEFPGQPARDTVWEAQRENLPTPVQPGVTYRNIGIRLKITSVFRDIDRIVSEALGEIPISDDTKGTGTLVKPSINANGQPPPSQASPSQPPRRER